MKGYGRAGRMSSLFRGAPSSRSFTRPILRRSQMGSVKTGIAFHSTTILEARALGKLDK